MNRLKRVLFTLSALIILVSCEEKIENFFEVDTTKIEIGAEGGSRVINVSSNQRWAASTQATWITVSPANGKATTECKIIIDSALTFDSRENVVRISNLDTDEYQEFTISQSGFERTLSIDEPEVDLPDYDHFDNRNFKMVVESNVDFDVVLSSETEKWLTYEKNDLVLDRGARPRKTTVSFRWDINSRPAERVAEITFQPKDGGAYSTADPISVKQQAAAVIEPGAKGDSLAVIAINRNLQTWLDWDQTLPMTQWENVEIWEEDDPGYKPEYKGRVKYAKFYIFETKESIPYEIQYLTAAEEIYIFGNTNTFMKSLDTGEYITKLTQLKRLTIGAYGLVSLHKDFVNLKNLEYLDLSSNNFQKVPEMLNPENFPNLRSLIMNANQRHAISDLSNNTRSEIGGFFDDGGLPIRLLEWDNLDTLRLSVNFLQGNIPDMKNHRKYTAEDIASCDSLPEALIGMPKVLPNIKMFAINYNRFSGEIPDWMLYHPNFDQWYPFILVFNQEGKDSEGNLAGFTNEPANMDYYYDFYKGFKDNPYYEGEDEISDTIN